jgi:hypothetical protein
MSFLSEILEDVVPPLGTPKWSGVSAEFVVLNCVRERRDTVVGVVPVEDPDRHPGPMGGPTFGSDPMGARSSDSPVITPDIWAGVAVATV